MEERKPKGTYDKIIIASIGEDPVFQTVNANWTTPDGRSLQQVFGFKPTKRLEEIVRGIPVEVDWFGGKRTWRAFARVEQGFPEFRLSAVLKELNTEIAKFDVDDQVKGLKQLIHDYYEKAVCEFDYVRRNPVTGSFEFKPWTGMQLRSKRLTSSQSIAMTEESEPEQTQVAIRQSKPRAAKKSIAPAQTESTISQETSLGLEASGSQEEAPISNETAMSSQATEEEAPPSQSTGSDEVQPTPEAVEQRQEEVQPSQEEVLQSPPSDEPLTGTASITPDANLNRQEVDDAALMPPPPAALTDAPDEFDAMIGSTALSARIGMDVSRQTSQGSQDSQDSRGSSGSDTPGIFDAAFVADQSTANISTANATLLANISRAPAARSEEDPNFTFVGGQEGLVTEEFVDVAPAHQFVTKDDLRAALDGFFARLMSAISAENEEVREEIKGLKIKVESKFAGLKRTKQQVKETYNLVSELNLKQGQLPKTPTKSAGGNAVLQGKAKSLLFRCLPFNFCGKGCDIFFGSPFVREQVTELIAPYFSNVSIPTLHAVISRTCIFTCFTPLARAHMIFGENKNSRKMLKFNKRPLPEGFFTLTKKCIVPRISYQLNLQPGSVLPNIADIAETCAGTFNTERNNFLTHAVKRTKNNEEAVKAIVECDFKFQQWNSHTQPLNMVVPSIEEHSVATRKRAELKAGLKDEIAGNLNKGQVLPPFDQVFSELSAKCSMEIEDPKMMIRLILVAGHLNGDDYKTMAWDRMEFVPDFPQLHAEVLAEIGDDITPLVQKFTADAVNYLPDIVLAVDETKAGKRRSPVKKVTYPSAKTPTTTAAAKKAFFDETDVMSEDSGSSSSDNDDDCTPSTSKRPRIAEQPVAPQAVATLPPPEVPTLLLSESSESN